MGVSFQGCNHCSGNRGTAVRQAHGPQQSRRTPKSDLIMVAAPQRKVAGTTWPLCASPGSPENAQRAHSTQLAAGLASELQL